MNLSIFTNLKNPMYLFVMLGVGVLMFDINYYLMSNLPGTHNNMCVIGGYLTPGNILFSVVLSLMTGMMVAAFIALYKYRKTKLAAYSTGGIGLFIGTFTVFCTFCTVPVISLFGLSLSLQFFTTFNWLFKAVSLGMMVIGLYLINDQLVGNCVTCKINH